MRPYIICHMMSSVDGRIIGDRWTPAYDGTGFDTTVQCYYDISNDFGVDAEWLGRKTVQTDLVKASFDHRNEPPAQNLIPFSGTRDTKRMCIVMDPTGKIRYSENTIMGENIIVVLGESVSESYLAHLRELGISYLFAGPNGNDLEKAMNSLFEMGIRKIVLQGGGFINGTFLKAGLIDELSLLIYPGVDGLAGSSTVFDWAGTDGERPAKGQALELLSVKTMSHGVIWMQYKFHGQKSNADN